MAKRNSNSNNFKEYEMKGKQFDYSGRVYPDNKREAGKLTIYPMSLTLDGVFTIKGCSLMMTKDNLWISFPQYKSGDDYKDYVYTDKDLNEDLDNLAAVVEKAIK